MVRVATGISAHDRSRTIQVAVDPDTVPEDLCRPGHVFPLRARPGGVLERVGQTEASVDLVRLAGMGGAQAFLTTRVTVSGAIILALDIERIVSFY